MYLVKNNIVVIYEYVLINVFYTLDEVNYTFNLIVLHL